MIRRLTLIALLVAAATSHAADPSKRWHGILPEDAPGFDPSGPSNTSAAAVVELIFDRLLTNDYLARPAKLVPLAAEAMPAISEAEAPPDGAERNRLFIAMSRQADADTAWVLGAHQRRIVALQPWVLGHKTHPFLYSVLPYVDVKPH